MCRLYGFLANEPTKVDCSLIYAQNALMLQSRHDERGLHHSDGWGISTYRNGIPELQKEVKDAFEDRMFSSAAERIYSTAIVAHIRKATVGQNSIYNTHPFVYRNWTFAHNGTVTGFEEIGQQLASETAPDLQLHRMGETDSEQFFLWLLTRLQQGEFDGTNAEATTANLAASVKELADRCLAADPIKPPRLNFILTDGETLFACRWNNSLHLIRREGIYDCEICGIPHIHHHETVNHRAVAVASEPVTHEAWREVKNESVIALTFSRERTEAG